MAHTPLKHELSPRCRPRSRYAWTNSYSPAATRRAIDSIADEPVPYKISHLIARLFFRGIYFPQKGTWGWLKLMAQNRRHDFPDRPGIVHQLEWRRRPEDPAEV